MKMVGIRELKNKLSEYLGGIEREGALIITNHGQPCAAILPLPPEEMEDFILAHSPRIKRMAQKGLKEVKSGKYVTLEELLSEFDEETGQ